MYTPSGISLVREIDALIEYPSTDIIRVQTYKAYYPNIDMWYGEMVTIYVFEARVVKTSGKYLIYPPKEYQEKLKKHHGKKLKVIVIEESN